MAARREKHNAKVWAANPKTQGLKSAYDAAQAGRFCLLRGCTLRRGRGELIWSSFQEKKEKAAGALPGSARQALAQHGVEKTNNGGVL